MSRLVRVVAAAIVRDGTVLAARRAPGAARGGLWELPGGKVEAGESDGQAIEREIREELGADVTAVTMLASSTHDYGDIAIELVAWVCRPVTGTVFRPHEHDALRWLGPGELGDVTWAPADLPLLGPLLDHLRGG